MKIRRRLSKILLSVTAMFWASCSDNSQPLYGVISVEDPVPESSEAIESSSSIPSEDLSSSSESPESSSSDTPESSSSSPAEVLSSSSDKLYRLARDTSVTCTAEIIHYDECVYYGGSSEACYSLESKLEANKTQTIEELIEIEDRLENCAEAVTVYGIPPCMHQLRVSTGYKCSNSNTTLTGYREKDGLIYRNAEYDSLFNSSSSVASSSSAAPAPLCQKTDFIYKHDSVEDISKEKLDSLATAGETVSDSLKKCVRRSFPYEEGKYAKTQICDGDTTVNPRYQAKLDSIREKFDKAIEDCKAAEVPTDSTTTPADSTVAPPDTLPPT